MIRVKIINPNLPTFGRTGRAVQVIPGTGMACVLLFPTCRDPDPKPMAFRVIDTAPLTVENH